MNPSFVCSAGVPPTQLHRYGSLGCINLPAVLEPLDFLLPQREMLVLPPSVPELDLAAELNSLTFEPQSKEPATDPGFTVEMGGPDPALTRSDLRDSEPMEPKSEELDEEIEDEEFSLE